MYASLYAITSIRRHFVEILSRLSVRNEYDILIHQSCPHLEWESPPLTHV